MKAKHLFLAIAVLLAAGGFWLAWRTHAARKSSIAMGFKTAREPNLHPNSAAALTNASRSGAAAGPNSRPKPGQILRPPDQVRRFTDFTPEQRVKFARRGHGPGG